MDIRDNVARAVVLQSKLIQGRVLTLVAFSLAFKCLNVMIFAPLIAVLMRVFLERWGRASVGNFEIAQFLLSPVGLVAICVVGSIIMATLYMEIAGLMHLMIHRRIWWWELGTRAFGVFPRLVRLGAIQMAATLVMALPFVFAIGLVYRWLWAGRDLNGLIILKPAEFWWGAGIAGFIAVCFVLMAAWLHLRWLMSVPCLLQERGVGPLGALARSRQLAKANSGTMIACVVLWFIGQAAFASIVLGGTQFALEQTLAIPVSSLTGSAIVTGFALLFAAFINGLVSVIANIGFATTLLALYRFVSGVKEDSTLNEPALPSSGAGRDSGSVEARWKLSFGHYVAAGIAIPMCCSLWGAYWVCGTLAIKDRVQITAHRAGAKYAPENTIAAIKRAIADGADWAEIDVQLTSDLEIVVMHDTDLARVGGGAKQVGNATLAEIQKLDVGRLFSDESQGEQIPLFRDLLVAAKDRVKLNVELKPHGAGDGPNLTRRVVAEIQKSGMVSQCRICSQSYESIQLAKQLEPAFEIGYISATSLGDVTKLQVNYLMLSHKGINEAVVARARSKSIEIHAWTVNDSRLVPKLVDDGVRNIITDDVPIIREQFAELESLSPVERLLIRAKHAILD